MGVGTGGAGSAAASPTFGVLEQCSQLICHCNSDRRMVILTIRPIYRWKLFRLCTK